VDTSSLEAGYDEVLAAVTRGEFAPLPEREWPAEQVLAHLVVDGRLLRQVTAELLAGGRPVYDNAEALEERELAKVAAAAGDLDGLVHLLRRGGQALVQLAAELDDHLAATEVRARIADSGKARIDQAMRWGDVLELHGRVHLPSHAAELQELRS
jgi:hypothetical protein